MIAHSKHRGHHITESYDGRADAPRVTWQHARTLEVHGAKSYRAAQLAIARTVKQEGQPS